MESKHWQHEVRDAIRYMNWRAAAARRSDMDGIQNGIDRVATSALLNNKRISDQRKGVLRTILCGAFWTGRRLASAKLRSSCKCPFCDLDADEDEMHI
eukprot:10642478-Karenia_brevis.AAC.1